MSTETQGIKGVILGPPGIGKTSLLHSLDPARTLALDLEAGMLSVRGWQGTVQPVRSWPEARALAAVIGGIDPASEPDKPYGAKYYEQAIKSFPLDMVKYSTVFIDSITVASRLCLKWVKQQPEAFDKQGQFSNLKAYGLLGQEMMSWLVHLQHTQGKNIWFVGILEKESGDLGEVGWNIQMEGSKAGKELPGIVDQVITMQEITTKKDDVQTKRRAFICQGLNRWNYPAKDRSGVLAMVEPAHLGKLMEKILTNSKSVMSPNFDVSDFLADEIIY